MAISFVIKPGDDLPTAGGYGVMICYNDHDLAEAQKRIEEATEATDQLIIEQKLKLYKTIVFNLLILKTSVFNI